MAYTFASAQDEKAFPELKGPYLGQMAPGLTPVLFAPGIVSTGMNERDITIAPDGKEIFYGLTTGRTVTIMHSCYRNGLWTEPAVASFAVDDRFFYFEPCLSSDGNRIYFLTTMPANGKEPRPGWGHQNIFAADRKTDGSWGDPYDTGSNINGDMQQFYPSMTKTQKLYFCRTDPATRRNTVHRATIVDGVFTLSEKLPAPVNTDSTNPYNAYIAPDESFLIACIGEVTYEKNPGRPNYFIFFRNDDDTWSDPVPFGPEINIRGSGAMSSSLSPDGKYLFFAAQVNAYGKTEPGERTSLSRFKEISNSPQNGNSDIYWVDASVIEKLRSLSVNK